MLKPVNELRVRITSSTVLPDPTNIQSTGDWYYLYHLSSGLAHYDSAKKTFLPMLSSSWSESANGTHVFKLRDGIKFHDGTPITTKDILWSIKRHLILKTSTHFPLWDYLVGCDQLKSLEDECPGLTATANNEIVFRLKAQTDSFYLQLASPETGIWAASDMNVATTGLRPTKFSGPYFLESCTDDDAILKRNKFSLISEKFPNSPRTIRLKRIPLSSLDNAVVKKDIDLAIKQYTPMGERAWKDDGIQVHATAPSSIIYFFGTGASEDRAPVGQDLLKALWKNNKDSMISPGDSFLPFSGRYGLKREEFLKELPAQSSKTLRILCPERFFPKAFLDQVIESGKSVGTDIQISFANQMEFFAAFNNPKTAEKFDYVLSIYAASERYPAVQLRYMTKGLAKPTIDLKQAESPDFTEDREIIFKNYEKWLLRSHQAIPLYFDVTLFVHQPNIDIGEQSTSDAEIELWRVQEK